MSDWVVVGNYASSAEAEMYIEILREAGIPAVLRSEGPIFGAGFSGTMPRGSSIAVAAELAEQAHELIDDPDDMVIDESV